MLLGHVFLYLFPCFKHKKNKNNLREFELQNGKKFKKTQAEFKKVVSYIKKKVYAPQCKMDSTTVYRRAKLVD